MALRRDLNVAIEPLTERLVEPGFDPLGLDYSRNHPLDLGKLNSPAARSELVERVVGIQAESASILVPPHFYVSDDFSLNRNVDLAGLTVHQFRAEKKRVRAILAISRAFLAKDNRASQVAKEFLSVGVKSLDLRLSPLGGEGEGPVKVGTAFQILDALRDGGLDVLLGFQPAIGHTALALGLASGYSSGIGYRERFDHVAAIRQQSQPKAKGEGFRGALAGVFLPYADVTVSRWVARSLYADPSIRTKLRCELGPCATDISWPAKFPREHYLHAHADLIRQLTSYPSTWRASHELDRLKGAIELRRSLNEHHMPKLRETRPVSNLGTRTLETLASLVDRNIERTQSA